MKTRCIRLLIISFSFQFFLASAFSQTPYELVNPFIGTGGHGHTYPGATVPHGAVQVSPDTRKGNWDACAGYHYSDNTLLGFSNTHLSGTGCADLGDLLIRPCPEIPTFSHDNEYAEPGYYSVLLDDSIFCELTATTYCGMHHYKYPEGTENLKLVLDLGHVLDKGGYATKCEANVTAPNEICGVRRTHSWVNGRTIYFCIRFDRSFSTTQVYGDYDIVNGEQKVEKTMDINFYGQNEVVFKIGISKTSISEAKLNMEHDIKGFNFDDVRFKARVIWEKELNRILIDGGTLDQRTIFYTSLYHSLVVPNIISDASSKERIYSTFSNWDTFRAWNPLMTLIDPQLVNDMINSMLWHYDKWGKLPMWGLQGMETNCMIGIHTASIIWDAYQKGIQGFDAEKALKALVKTSEKYGRGIRDYVSTGFFPSDKTKESVSETLELAYDDWCIAMLAYALGHKDIYEEYSRRSRNYINVFDGKTRFFRGRMRSGNFNNDFNCYRQTIDYTEATPWQYRFFVPHDVNGMVQLFGGEENFIAALDSLFTTDSKIVGGVDDISGLIGQYAHGNEPSHHMAYLYTYLGLPQKTDKYVFRILNDMYKNAPDGIVGNEDCGQMSAWYILSSIGLYQMCPGSGVWVGCNPLFSNVYINGAPLANYQLAMYQYSESQWKKKVSMPYVDRDLTSIRKGEDVKLGCATSDAKIYYTQDGKEPTQKSKRYSGSIKVKGNVLMIRAFKEGFEPSAVNVIQIK